MRGIAFGFFFIGTICVTLGMCWGIVMAASGDHLLAPAHAHLNLAGWVTMALFGIYYHLVPEAAQRQLARFHLIIASIGLVIFVPGIALAIQGKTEIFAILGSILTLSSMVIFLIVVIGSRPR